MTAGTASSYILIIDDDRDIVDALLMVFEAYGYPAKSALNKKDAFALIENKIPSVIILDYLLSGTDGVSMCRMLRAHAATSAVPVIMVSAHPDASAASRHAGADDFLEKPFDITDLIARVERFMTVREQSGS